MPRKPAAKALHHLIHQQLRAEILGGELAVGTPLRQDALAERFNSSRIPVREALQQLEAEGLVEHRLNKGAVVAGMSVTEICEILDIRVVLECYAAQLAVPNMVERDFEAMQKILDAYTAADSVGEWAEYNRRFHLALSAPANNRRLRRLIEEFCLNTDRYTHVEMSKATGKEDPQADHYRILEAARRRDTAAVVEMLEAHIMDTKRELLALARAQEQGELTDGLLLVQEPLRR